MSDSDDIPVVHLDEDGRRLNRQDLLSFARQLRDFLEVGNEEIMAIISRPNVVANTLRDRLASTGEDKNSAGILLMMWLLSGYENAFAIGVDDNFKKELGIPRIAKEAASEFKLDRDFRNSALSFLKGSGAKDLEEAEKDARVLFARLSMLAGGATASEEDREKAGALITELSEIVYRESGQRGAPFPKK